MTKPIDYSIAARPLSIEGYTHKMPPRVKSGIWTFEASAIIIKGMG